MMDIVGIRENRITLRDAFDAQKVRGRKTITIRGPGGIKRTGVLHVKAIEEDVGVIITEEPLFTAVPTACIGDTVFAREETKEQPTKGDDVNWTSHVMRVCIAALAIGFTVHVLLGWFWT